MDLEELNKQMQFFQNDFQNQPQPTSQSQPTSQPPSTIQPQQLSYQQQLQQLQQLQQQQQNTNAINFYNPNPAETPFNTTQIKRAKSGEHRNDINDKLNSLNMFQPMQNDGTTTGMAPNMMPLHSRNYSNYEEESQEARSPMANYYNHNFNTLQGANNIYSKSPMNDIIAQQNSFTNQSIHTPPVHNTHNDGMTFINVRNMIAQQSQNMINTSGYNKIEEKRMDYRQNMNNKIDNFIFDNPNTIPFNPILQSQSQGQSRDTRMVIQDSNKDYYRQEANSRMSSYSPLSRASNVPITMANMSVNDFYANMQPTLPYGTGLPPIEDDKKAVLNSRMGQYAPLAKTIQYQTQSQPSTQSSAQPSGQPSSQPSAQHPMQVQQQKTFNNWNDVNKKTQNVYYNPLPVMSNK